jgi:energy-coupling factor transporter ATP-binding protein EcfA2
MNGVLMGLTRRDAQRRLDAVVEFAELQDFVDLKLKNYSSGMMVRLAFAIMVQADADIMLIDEVLAVGDAAFAQKCMDVFHERRRAGKTVVLVTHDMATVQTLCHRAMLLHEGELQYVGNTEDAALRYYRLNFAEHGEERLRAGGGEAEMDVNVRVVDATVRDQSGDVMENVEHGTPINVDILIEAARDLPAPTFVFHVVSEDGGVVCSFTHALERRVATGQRVRLRGTIENRLVAGRYYLDCWIREDEHESMAGLQAVRILRFLVFGTMARHGLVTLDTDIDATVE